MSGTIVLGRGRPWDVSSGIFYWVVEFLARSVIDPETRATLALIGEQGFGWLDCAQLSEVGRDQVLSALRRDLVPDAVSNFPVRPLRDGASAVLRELAALADARDRPVGPGVRPLSEREYDSARWILLSVEGVDGVAGLVEQLPHAAVVGDVPSGTLTLAVPERVPSADVPDGAPPGRAAVVDEEGHVAGEILVRVGAGRPVGLELAWLTDERPAEWPPVRRLTWSSAR
jgi:hypothetical protein